jgi:hypothetical protein
MGARQQGGRGTTAVPFDFGWYWDGRRSSAASVPFRDLRLLLQCFWRLSAVLDCLSRHDARRVGRRVIHKRSIRQGL